MGLFQVSRTSPRTPAPDNMGHPDLPPSNHNVDQDANARRRAENAARAQTAGKGGTGHRGWAAASQRLQPVTSVVINIISLNHQNPQPDKRSGIYLAAFTSAGTRAAHCTQRTCTPYQTMASQSIWDMP